MTFGEALLAARTKAGLSQAAVAGVVGCKQANIGHIESGRNSMVRDPGIVRKIEVAVGVERGELLRHLPPGHPAHTYYAAEVAAAKPAVKPPKKYPRREEPAPPGVEELEVYGTIAAGPDDEPTVFADDERPVVYLQGDFHPDAYALQVTGESCTNWGIVHGDIVAIDPVKTPRNGRFHALRSAGGRHTLKAYLDGQWWQFRPGDAEPVLFPLPGDTYLIGVVCGGKYAERFYRPGKRGTKGRNG